MLYMSGGGVQIFSMGIVFMLLLSPFKNLAGINSGTYASVPRVYVAYPCYGAAVFAPLAPISSDKKKSPNPNALSTLPLQKIVYLLCNVLTLALGLWKCRSMGLLPTGTGDWLAFENRGPVSDSAYNRPLVYNLMTSNAVCRVCPHMNTCILCI